ncbi:MAG: secretin N-terminal domain-containing protein, partial [Planctomycetota bacterium]
MIEQLDSPGRAGELDFRRVPLRYARPTAALPIVTEMATQLKAVQPDEPISVSIDSRTRALIVGARPTILSQIEKLIREVDTPSSFSQAEIRLFPLKRANATQLASVLEAMLKPGSNGNVSAEALALQEQVRALRVHTEAGLPVILDLSEPIKVQADPIAGSGGGNRLIVTSSPTNLRAMEVVIGLMDTVPVVPGITVRFVRVENADAQAVATIVAEVFSQGQTLAAGPTGPGEPDDLTGRAVANPVSVSVDPRTSTIVLSGQEASVTLALGIISDLDRESDPQFAEVRLFRLKHVSVGRVLPLLQEVFAESAPVPGVEGRSTSVTRLRTRLLGDPKSDTREKTRAAVTVQADPSSNVLIVTARAELLPLIEDFLQSLDVTEAEGARSFRLFALEHASATRVATAIQSLLSGPGADGLPIPDVPNVTVDSRSNSVIAWGSDRGFQLVEGLVAQLDRRTETGIRIEAIPLRHNTASALATSLSEVFAARQKASGTENAKPEDAVEISVDSLTNSLLVVASDENQAIVRELLEKVDIAPVVEGGTVHVFTLEHADAQRAAQMLRTLVGQGVYRPGASSSATAGRNRLSLIVDARTNSLVISASPENLSVVRELISRIDQESFEALSGVEVFTLEKAEAIYLAPVLQQFFAARRVSEGPDSTSTPITVVPDARTNTLIVAASREGLKAAKTMIAQLDVDHRGGYDARIFALNKSDANRMRQTILDLFQNRPRRAGEAAGPPINVIADGISNTLIVTALKTDLENIQNLIDRFESQESRGANVRVIPLAKADARAVINTVNSLYREGQQAGGGISASVDERLNAIVLSGGEADLDAIEKLVRELDSDDVARVNEIRVFGLQHANASDLARLLNDSLLRKAPSLSTENNNQQTLLQFASLQKNGVELVASALQEGLVITPDSRTNSLIVSAPPESLALIDLLVSQLDSTAPQRATIKIFSLMNADAVQMAGILSQLFRLTTQGPPLPVEGGEGVVPPAGTDRAVRYSLSKAVPTEGSDEAAQDSEEGVGVTVGSAEQQALVVTVDSRTNSLLVGGTEPYVNLAAEIIEELDASPAREQKVEVYRLKNAKADEIQTAVTNFLDQRRQRLTTALSPAAIGSVQRLLDEEAAIVAEPASNTLLVTASPRFFDQIKLLIEELDQPQPQVLIQVLLAEVTLNDSLDLGVDWDVIGEVGDDPVSLGTDLGVANDLSGFSASLTGGEVSFLLRAIKNTGRLKVLSRPQILAVDNIQAEINIGQSVPQITGSTTTELGNVNNTVEYREVGVILRVTPRISIDGFVKMEVSPEISSLSNSSIDFGTGVTAPVFNERKATTTVSVQDGHSIVIGGLISTSENETIAKVPILGDIPIL